MARIIAFQRPQLARSTSRANQGLELQSAGVWPNLGGLDAFQQHLLVIASHAERNAPGLHPCEGVDASRSAVDQIAQCEEAVALGRELDLGQQALQRRELAVHVSDDEIATGGGILPHPYAELHSQLSLLVLGSGMRIV